MGLETISPASGVSESGPTYDATQFNILSMAFMADEFGSHLLFEDTIEDNAVVIRSAAVGE